MKQTTVKGTAVKQTVQNEIQAARAAQTARDARTRRQGELEIYPEGFPVSDWEELSWLWSTCSLGSRRAAAIWMWKKQQARIEELEAELSAGGGARLG